MNHDRRSGLGRSLLVSVAFACSIAAQSKPEEIKPVAGIIPTGLGESVDRDIAKVRAATGRFRLADNAIASGYPAADHCMANPPVGAMGYHFQKESLLDAKLEVERPEILVYEKTIDGSFKLNGVEYIVPIDAWKRDEPPAIMGQKLKRAPKLGIWYLHVWIWEPNPSGIFADWNPRVKC